MTDYPVGSVSAKLVLDSKEFKEQVRQAKESLKSLTEALKKGSFKTSINDWKQMARELKQNSNQIKNVKKDLNNLKKGLDSQTESTKKAQTNLQSLSKEYINAKKNIDAMAKSLNRQITASQGFSKARNNLNTLTSSYNRSLSQDMVNKSYNEARNTLNTIAKSIDATRVASKGYKQALNDINTISRNLELNRVTQEMNKQTAAARELANANNQLKQSYYNYRKSLPKTYNDYTNYLNNQKAQTKITSGTAGGNGYATYLSQINAVGTKTIGLNKNLALSFADVRSKGSGLMNVFSGLKTSVSLFNWVAKGMIHDFATKWVMSLVEATKETITNKSEMDSMLQQMKLTGNQVNSFNKALDNTISRFQKMNKYSLGETVSSLGVEFRLNAKEMEKAMPIVAMVQSEYIRAGRTAEEASLAVKDVLQGEFQRLSRETGVGRNELLAAGWNGKNTDVMSLLTALEKIGTSRHWDVFAEKATSLNDILIITSNRLTEFVARLESFVTPAITGIFNGLISLVSSISGWFNNLDPASKLFTSFTTLTAVIGTVGTVLVMYRTKLGLAQLAQLGLKNSILATIFSINAEEIALFKSEKGHNAVTKAIVKKITGYKTETVAALSAKRAIAAYVLGLDGAIVKEHGFKTALIGSKLGLLDNEKELVKIRSAGLKWHQTLSVLTGKVDVATAKNMSFAKSLKTIISSGAALKTIGLTAFFIVLAVAIGHVWSQCEKAKKAVEGFNDVIENGQQYVTNAQNSVKYFEGIVNSAKQHVENASSAREEADAVKYLTQAEKDLATAKDNVANAEEAYNRAKQVKQDLANRKSQIDIRNQQELSKIYQENGIESDKANVKAYDLLSNVDAGTYYLQKGMKAYENTTRDGLKHVEEHTNELAKQNVSLKARQKYAEDYASVVQEQAYKWKQFNEGDMWAGVTAAWLELVKIWIDISNNPEFVKFAEECAKAWGNLQPVFNQIGDALHWIGNALIIVLQYGARFVAWLSESQAGSYILMGGLGLLIAKLAGIGGKAKGTIDALKKIGENAKSAYDRLKELAKNGGVLDALKDKLGKIGRRGKNKDSSDDDSDDGTVVTTGSGKGKGKKKKKPKKKDKNKGKNKDKGKGKGKGKGKTKTKTPKGKTTDVGFKEGIVEDLKSQGRFAVKAATGIAIGMGLMTEAIALLQMPLFALASTGDMFKSNEENIRKGGETLKFVSDLLISTLPLVVAFAITLKLSARSDIITLTKDAITEAYGLLIAMLLVTEAVLLLNVPLLAIAGLGTVYSGIEGQVKQGAEVLKLISDTLLSIIPLVLVFGGVVILSGKLLKTGKLSFLKDAAAGIAIGLLLVSEAIIGLALPLLTFAGLGWVYDTIGSTNIDRGIQAVQACSNALNSLAPFIPLFIAGVLIAASAFATGGATFVIAVAGVGAGLVILSEAIIGMVAPLGMLAIVGTLFPDLTSIQQGANAIKVVGEALTIIGMAMIPLLAVLTTDFISKITTGGQGISEYIKGLVGENGVVTSMKEFATELNKMEIPQVDNSKATQIQAIATSIQSINRAVQTVQSAVSNNTGDFIGGVANVVGSMIPGGNILGNLVGGGSAGGYSSSLGGKLKQLEDMVNDIIKFNNNINTATSGKTADVSGATSMVTAISNAVKGMSSALDNAISTASTKGKSIGQAIKQGISSGMMGLSTVISTQLANGFNYGGVNARSHGKSMGNNAKTGFVGGFKIKEATDKECRGALQVMEDKKQYFYNKGYQLGQSASNGYKDGMDIHSPGIMWRSTIAEVTGIGQALSNTTLAYNSAKSLAEAVVNGYAPTMANFANNTYSSLTSNANSTLGVMGLDPMLNQPALQQFQADASMATGLSQNIALTTQNAFVGLDTVMGSTFSNMGLKLQTTFNGINTSASSAYTKMGTTTRVQMNNMKNQTTRHIHAITNSWHGMQNALISSAEYIRSQTGAKINQLEHNMGSFWRKVQNPALLMGSAGGDFSTTSTRTPISNPVKSGVIKTMNSSSPKIRIPKGSFGAGGYSKTTGISNSFKPRMNNDDIDFLAQYINCLNSGKECYAGGWNFNWTDDIRQALLHWRTNFGAIYDPYLSVGKFENDDFPVRGIPEICKGYIYDAISRTSYQGYMNSKTGGDPVAAYNSGMFNCYDGALIIMALARAFGFSSSMRHGSWNGVPHVWAHVDGIGDIDATAIQQGYGFTSPKVSGIGTRSSLKPPEEESKVDKSLHLTLNIDMRGANVSDESIGQDIGDIVVDKIIDLTGVNKNTGR